MPAIRLRRVALTCLLVVNMVVAQDGGSSRPAGWDEGERRMRAASAGSAVTLPRRPAPLPAADFSLYHRTDALLDAGHTAALADARGMTPQAVADWLAQWVK